MLKVKWDLTELWRSNRAMYIFIKSAEQGFRNSDVIKKLLLQVLESKPTFSTLFKLLATFGGG